MTFNRQQVNKGRLAIAFVAMVLAVSLPLAGCGGGGGTAFKKREFDEIPAGITQERELLNINLLAKLERVNPFEDLLAPEEPVVAEVGPDNEPVQEAPVVDPFTGIRLAGIFYKDKLSRAILKIDGENLSKIVTSGEVFQNAKGDDAQIRVAAINGNTIKLESVDKIPGYEEKTFEMSSLVGYSTQQAAPKPKANDFTGKKYLIEEPDTLEIPNLILDVIKGDDRKNSPEKLKEQREKFEKGQQKA